MQVVVGPSHDRRQQQVESACVLDADGHRDVVVQQAQGRGHGLARGGAETGVGELVLVRPHTRPVQVDGEHVAVGVAARARVEPVDLTADHDRLELIPRQSRAPGVRDVVPRVVGVQVLGSEGPGAAGDLHLQCLGRVLDVVEGVVLA